MIPPVPKKCVNCKYFHTPGGKSMCLVFENKIKPSFSILKNFMDPEDARKDISLCGPNGTFFVEKKVKVKKSED